MEVRNVEHLNLDFCRCSAIFEDAINQEILIRPEIAGAHIVLFICRFLARFDTFLLRAAHFSKLLCAHESGVEIFGDTFYL